MRARRSWSSSTRPLSTTTSLSHYRDAVAELLHLPEIVGGEEDGGTAGTGVAQQLEECLLRDGVEGGRGLVEDEQAGTVLKRLHEGYLLLHAVGVALYLAGIAPPAAGPAARSTASSRGRPRRSAACRHIRETRCRSCLRTAWATPARKPMRRRTSAPSDLRVQAKGPHCPGRRLDEAEHDVYRRALPRAVRTEVSEDLPLADRQVEPVQRVNGAVPLVQALDVDDGNWSCFMTMRAILLRAALCVRPASTGASLLSARNVSQRTPPTSRKRETGLLCDSKAPTPVPPPCAKMAHFLRQGHTT